MRLEALLPQTVLRINLPILVALTGFIQHGASLLIEGGDTAEQIPQTLHVRFQLALTAGRIAILRAACGIHRTAEYGKLVINGDVLTGHLRITDKERRRGQACDAASDNVGLSFLRCTTLPTRGVSRMWHNEFLAENVWVSPFPHGVMAAHGSLEPFVLVRVQVGELAKTPGREWYRGRAFLCNHKKRKAEDDVKRRNHPGRG